MDGGKIVKFVKVFSLESFPLYGTLSKSLIRADLRSLVSGTFNWVRTAPMLGAHTLAFGSVREKEI